MGKLKHSRGAPIPPKPPQKSWVLTEALARMLPGVLRLRASTQSRAPTYSFSLPSSRRKMS